MKAPKLPSIFKQSQAKGFEFKPRYYDERKERIENLRQKYALYEEAAKKRGEERSRILEDKLRSEWQGKRQASVNSSNRTLLAIIILLLFVTYYIITY